MELDPYPPGYCPRGSSLRMSTNDLMMEANRHQAQALRLERMAEKVWDSYVGHQGDCKACVQWNIDQHRVKSTVAHQEDCEPCKKWQATP